MADEPKYLGKRKFSKEDFPRVPDHLASMLAEGEWDVYEVSIEGAIPLTPAQSRQLDEIEACERRVREAEEALRSEAAIKGLTSAVFADKYPNHPKVAEARRAYEAQEQAGHLLLS